MIWYMVYDYMIYDSALGLGLGHGVSSPAFGPDGVLVDSDQGPSGGGLPAFGPDGVLVDSEQGPSGGGLLAFGPDGVVCVNL